MRISPFILSTVLAIAISVPAVAGQSGASGLAFETSTIEYGIIAQGSNGARSVSFTNTGNEPIKIYEAHGSCACVAVSYPTNAILPGEQGEIQVDYDTNRVGPFEKTVVVIVTGSPTPYVLRVSGEVR
ncbi:MAG: DUF1573 domain-containing protein [Pseudomonadota bacterium]